MPDFGAPVADQITAPNPNQGMQTLSGVLTMANQRQNLQLGQQALQVGQGQAQQAQQQMAERQIFQQMSATGKDPDGNPVKTPDGQMDPVAFAAAANKYMPLTGQAVQQSIISTMDNRLKLNDSVRTLGQGYRNDISGIVRSGIGNQDPSAVSAGLDAYGQQNPQAAQSIGYAKSLLQHLNPAMPQDQKNMALEHLAQQLQPAGTTVQEQAPQMGTTTGPGGGVQAFQNNPLSPVPMGANGPETAQGIPLGERQGVTGNPTTGGFAVVSKNGQGQVTGITNPPTQGVYVPQPGDAEAKPMLSAERETARQTALNAGLQHTNNQIVLNNIDNVGATGLAGPGWRNLASAFGFNPGDATKDGKFDPATAYDLVGKGLERSALQAAQSMGPQTNAGLAAQVAANGSTHYTPQAIKEITRLNEGITTGATAYQAGLENAIKANPSAGVFAKRPFDEAWGANFDPKIYQMYNAAKSGDTAGVNSIVNSLGGKDSAQFKALMTKAANLQKLTNTGGLQ